MMSVNAGSCREFDRVRGVTGIALRRASLDNLVTPKQKLTKVIPEPKATWVEPRFHAETESRHHLGA